MNIENLIISLLPLGTTGRYLAIHNNKMALNVPTPPGAPKSWNACPAWPPDVFAVAATIIDLSGCYTYAGPQPGGISQHNHYLVDVFTLSSQWTNLSTVPSGIQELWGQLYGYRKTEIADICEQPDVYSVLFKLFAIADEACMGMGWTQPIASATSTLGASAAVATAISATGITFADFARTSLLSEDPPSPSAMILPNTPFSLCSLVPSDRAIVLPKSLTATVGCTVRSLSHHLALLPGQTQLLPSWRMVDREYPSAPREMEQMRMLIVPYPFNIPEDSFTLAREPQQLVHGLATAGYFSLEQKWLANTNAEKITNELLVPLIAEAEKESRGKIHGILMPECALSEQLAKEIADRLGDYDVEFFITGALGKESGTTKNIALTYIFTSKDGEKGVIHGAQSKHHRWRLDETQVKQYALNFPYDAKNPSHLRAKQWWEDIDVSERKLPFYALRPDMSLTVLICEDLARNDPAMSVIRAVGPNLVVALLMDGPQLGVRWPARYATILADDPGSSVLSITCASMVDRSNWTQSRPVRSIGLWRDSGGTTQELNLPKGTHGMLLTLRMSEKTQHTLDNRADGNLTRKLTLSTVVPLVLDEPPPWL